MARPRAYRYPSRRDLFNPWNGTLMRLSRVFRVLAAPAAVALLRLPAPAAADEPVTFPLGDVRPGMTATFHTVMRDTTIEPFDVEVLSVVRNIGPGQDMILARALGDRIEHEGVSQGMSGSPVYIDGKLLGAVSSTWSFAKEPLLGITPVGQMMSEAEGSFRRASVDGDAAPGRLGPGAAPGSGSGPPEPGTFSPSAALRGHAPQADPRGFAPIASPLVLSGFDRRLVDLAAQWFEPWGFRVVEGGAAGGTQQGGAIVPGATLGVRVAGGDANMTALGTATWIDGDRVYGWGHPFFQMGDVEMPLVSGYIHATVASRQLSFKFGSGGEVVGTLVNDRRSGIAGRLGPGPHLTTFDVTVRRGDDAEHFHYELIRHPQLGPTLTGIVAANSVMANGGSFGEETVRFRQRIVLDDGRDTTVETVFSGEQTLSSIVDLLGEAAGVIANNPFERVAIDSMQAELTYEPGIRLGTITEIALDDDTPRPGDTLRGAYLLRDYRGEVSRHRFSIPLPADAPEARYLLLIGDSRTAERFEAERAPRLFAVRSLDEFLERIRRLKQTDEVHIHLYRQSEGVLVDGIPLPDLPPSAMAILRGAARSGAADDLPAELVAEQRDRAGKVVQGAHTILFEVHKETP
jgi:SpoIVB peptidase S55